MSNRDNHFIEDDKNLTEYARLQMTTYNAVNVFAVLETLLAQPADGSEEITFDLEQFTGMQVIIAGAKAALNHVASQIDMLETGSKIKEIKS